MMDNYTRCRARIQKCVSLARFFIKGKCMILHARDDPWNRKMDAKLASVTVLMRRTGFRSRELEEQLTTATKDGEKSDYF